MNPWWSFIKNIYKRLDHCLQDKALCSVSTHITTLYNIHSFCLHYEQIATTQKYTVLQYHQMLPWKLILVHVTVNVNSISPDLTLYLHVYCSFDLLDSTVVDDKGKYTPTNRKINSRENFANGSAFLSSQFRQGNVHNREPQIWIDHTQRWKHPSSYESKSHSSIFP